MGLMDKVKAQATQLAQKTQEAAQEGKAKIDQAQANRRGDALLRQLGVAVFAEHTGRGTADSQAKIDQLISDISAHERENGLNLADPAPPVPPQQGFPPDRPSPFPGPAGGSAPDQDTTSFPDSGTSSPQASTSAPGSGSTSFPDAGGAPSVDTTTSFFPAPGDQDAEPGGPSGFPPDS